MMKSTDTALKTMENAIKEYKAKAERSLQDICAQLDEVTDRIDAASTAATSAVSDGDESAYATFTKELDYLNKRADYLRRAKEHWCGEPYVDAATYEAQTAAVTKEMDAYRDADIVELRRIVLELQEIHDRQSTRIGRVQAALAAWQKDVYQSHDQPLTADGVRVVGARRLQYPDNGIIHATQNMIAACAGFLAAHEEKSP